MKVPLKVAAPSVWDQVSSLRVEVGVAVDDTAPQSAFTVKQYAKQFNLPYQTAVQQVARLVAAHKLNAGQRLGVDENGRRRVLKVYWPA